MEEPVPQTTHAIIVGIERYTAGSVLDLDGPASDAIRFLQYVHDRGVPARIYVSTLLRCRRIVPPCSSRPKALATTVAEPTEPFLKDLMTRGVAAGGCYAPVLLLGRAWCHD